MLPLLTPGNATPCAPAGTSAPPAASQSSGGRCQQERGHASAALSRRLPGACPPTTLTQAASPPALALRSSVWRLPRSVAGEGGLPGRTARTGCRRAPASRPCTPRTAPGASMAAAARSWACPAGHTEAAGGVAVPALLRPQCMPAPAARPAVVAGTTCCSTALTTHKQQAGVSWRGAAWRGSAAHLADDALPGTGRHVHGGACTCSCCSGLWDHCWRGRGHWRCRPGRGQRSCRHGRWRSQGGRGHGHWDGHWDGHWCTRWRCGHGHWDGYWCSRWRRWHGHRDGHWDGDGHRDLQPQGCSRG